MICVSWQRRILHVNVSYGALHGCDYGITKSLPRGYGGGGPCEAWWKGRFERAGIRFDRDGIQQDLEEKLCV